MTIMSKNNFKELDDSLKQINNKLHGLSSNLSDSLRQNQKLSDEFKRKDEQIVRLEEMVKSQQEVIEFLTKQKFSSEDIEFAAIKRYRGWDCLYLNGQKINTDRSVDLTIYCDPGEPVRISQETE